MSKTRPERIRQIYYLWYEHLLRSDDYREFCALQKKAKEGEVVEWPERFQPRDIGYLSDYIWGVYHDQWGNIHENTFDSIWDCHGPELIAIWNDAPPLHHDVSIVHQELLKYLTDDFLDSLKSQSFRTRPPRMFSAPNNPQTHQKTLQGLASEIVLALLNKKSNITSLYISPENRRKIKVDVTTVDLQRYDQFIKASKNNFEIKTLIKKLGVAKSTFYGSIDRTSEKIKAVEKGFFLQ